MDYENYIKNLLPKRPQESHKGNFGHVLNIAGSGFYTGAAYFSSVSPLRVGAGRSTLASSEFVLSAVSSLCPDIILFPSENISKLAVQKFQAVSIGCGLSEETNAVKLFKKVLKLMEGSEIPFVIDADGLNILSASLVKSEIQITLAPRGRGQVEGYKLPQNTILTPHTREMSRLMGVTDEEILSQPDFWARKCAEKYNCTVVLKLHNTIVADNKGNFYENHTGNSALAHGGSGDVLCGMITGFLASGSRSEPESACEEQAEQSELNDGDVRACDKKGLGCFEACCLAVYLHGLAGEMASDDLTEYSTLASDLVDYIPHAIKNIAGLT